MAVGASEIVGSRATTVSYIEVIAAAAGYNKVAMRRRSKICSTGSGYGGLGGCNDARRRCKQLGPRQHCAIGKADLIDTEAIAD
ncbi:hypothetical protein C1X73_34395, partial [Pseudomonas sp. FW305-130]